MNRLTAAKREAADKAARELITRALAEHGGNLTQAAKSLGVERCNLRRQVRKLGLRRAA